MRAMLIVLFGSVLAITSAMAQSEIAASTSTTSVVESTDSAAAEANSIAASVDSPTSDEAEKPQSKHKHYQSKEDPCKAMNATAEQKEKIKAAMTELKTSSKDLRAQLRTSYKNLSTVVNDTNSDAAAASAALDALNTVQDSLRASLQASKLNILYSILNADQRAAGFACLEHAKRNRGERRGPPPHGHQPGPRQGPLNK
ncbi:MAG: hypothetical protein B7Y39_14405 [Bdellovibrio sp. 28-41-41]|nr:MAG: hypothetical protein B7Y39_14405 [Bdellovibrio sp. 28-41-41]